VLVLWEGRDLSHQGGALVEAAQDPLPSSRVSHKYKRLQAEPHLHIHKETWQHQLKQWGGKAGEDQDGRLH
jgi:hypothetical protein